MNLISVFFRNEFGDPINVLVYMFQKGELGDPAEFLAKALDPPGLSSILKAMGLLKEVGACEQGAPTLTPLGHHLALLPLNVRIGKMLLFGAMLGSLEPVVRSTQIFSRNVSFYYACSSKKKCPNDRKCLNKHTIWMQVSR